MTADKPTSLAPPNIVRGRPRTEGSITCARCGRGVRRTRASWPEGRICGPCFTTATRTYGTCPGCGHQRLLPGPPVSAKAAARCAPCAGISQDFQCSRCHLEGEFYRKGICARCALQDDLNSLLASAPERSEIASRLVEVLCLASRPESIITWKRSVKVRTLLTSIASGQTPLTHEGLDSHQKTAAREADHLRDILMHHGLLPHRDRYLVRFEHWIQDQLSQLPSEVARPAEQFAKWHHLRRIRPLESPERTLQSQVHSAKQEVRETIKFLSWLWTTHERTAANCTQEDVDTWQATGPTTRRLIRTFLKFAHKTRINTQIRVARPTTKQRPSITPEQRLVWLRELLEDTGEALPYRVAGILLLLYAQPLTKVAALRTSDVTVNDTTGAVRITLGKHPLPVPQPFAELLKKHLRTRPNLGTGTGAQSPWLFPGGRAGHHLAPNTVAARLLDLGMDLRGSRNTALDEHVIATPPPIIADALGYSYQVAHRHAEAAGDTWSRYIADRS